MTSKYQTHTHGMCQKIAQGTRSVLKRMQGRKHYLRREKEAHFRLQDKFHLKCSTYSLMSAQPAMMCLRKAVKRKGKNFEHVKISLPTSHVGQLGLFSKKMFKTEGPIPTPAPPNRVRSLLQTFYHRHVLCFHVVIVLYKL